MSHNDRFEDLTVSVSELRATVATIPPVLLDQHNLLASILDRLDKLEAVCADRHSERFVCSTCGASE